jgi:hypothetical protein
MTHDDGKYEQRTYRQSETGESQTDTISSSTSVYTPSYALSMSTSTSTSTSNSVLAHVIPCLDELTSAYTGWSVALTEQANAIESAANLQRQALDDNKRDSAVAYLAAEKLAVQLEVVARKKYNVLANFIELPTLHVSDQFRRLQKTETRFLSMNPKQLPTYMTAQATLPLDAEDIAPITIEMRNVFKTELAKARIHENRKQGTVYPALFMLLENNDLASFREVKGIYNFYRTLIPAWLYSKYEPFIGGQLIGATALPVFEDPSAPAISVAAPAQTSQNPKKVKRLNKKVTISEAAPAEKKD